MKKIISRRKNEQTKLRKLHNTNWVEEQINKLKPAKLSKTYKP